MIIRMRLRHYCIVLCSLAVLLTFLWIFAFGNDQITVTNPNSYSDQFISVKYVAEYEENPMAINRLINLTDFKYLQKPSVCEGELAILIVTSYVGNDEIRAAHRTAFSQQYLRSIRMQRIFLLAQIPSTEKFITQKSIVNENNRFDDLLQGNFNEAYRNLTYKHIMGLRWAANECESTKFIVKIDDDTVYDIFHLNRYLKELANDGKNEQKFIAGYVLADKQPIRVSANKWYVTRKEFPANIYPDYVSGWLYVTTRSAARALVHESLKQRFFWIDDTWITGVLRALQNISLISLNSWFSSNSDWLTCCIRDLQKSSLNCDYFIGPNGGNSKLIIDFTHAIEKCYIDDQSKCYQRSHGQLLNRTCVGIWKNYIGQHGEAIIKPIKL